MSVHALFGLTKLLEALFDFLCMFQRYILKYMLHEIHISILYVGFMEGPPTLF